MKMKRLSSVVDRGVARMPSSPKDGSRPAEAAVVGDVAVVVVDADELTSSSLLVQAVAARTTAIVVARARMFMSAFRRRQ